ncbi:hypothetical protein PYW07_007367 [Mythimna separata]|uniref:Peptide chain release factor domain-containing protein n=1 Tax=Mythimna separata TaxID=271217 RepID=A0AAD8DZY7_MYTSE|nr:hypothetical protein PYW07_007367 [Mythimna separata]
MHRKCSVFNISDFPVQAYLKNLRLEHENLNSKATKTPEESKRLFEIKPIINVFEQRNNLHDNIELLSKKECDDKATMEMVKKEGLSYLQRMADIDRDLQALLMEPKLTEGGVLLEVTAGAGQEAMLFAQQLFQMYESYADYKDWEVCIVSLEKPETEGITKGSMFIEGVGVPELMKIETGVHRVQRIPATEKGGRIHTSTASVTVVPKPTDIEAKVPYQDLVIETIIPSDKGEQHVNITDSAEHITQTPKTTDLECQENASEENEEDAVVEKLRTISWPKEKEDITSNTESDSKGGSSFIKDLVRTYDHAEDVVMEHREGGGIAHNLSEFMEGDYLLEQMQNNLLRINWRAEFMEEINQFADKINSKTADTN